MRFVSFVLLCAASAAASAQTPPIRPGLWEIKSDSSGRATADAAAKLQSLPPERRAQIEAMMKQRGIDLSGGVIKMCLSQESLDRGQWQQQPNSASGHCKTDYTSQTTSRWAWKHVCTEPAVTSEGEVMFMGDRAYDIKSTTTTVVDGKPKVTQVTMSSKWLAADCGDVKPVKKF